MGLTQVDVAEQIGVTRTPIQAIERGAAFKKITGTQRSYARLVGWTDDSIDKVLAGGEPILRSENQTPADSGADSAPAGLAALPPNVQQAITRDGKVIDASVFDVELPGVNGEMILVFKDKPTVAPEIAAADAVEIAKRYLKLRGLVPPESSSDDAAAQA